jgi:hypothetical protein
VALKFVSIISAISGINNEQYNGVLLPDFFKLMNLDIKAPSDPNNINGPKMTTKQIIPSNPAIKDKQKKVITMSQGATKNEMYDFSCSFVANKTGMTPIVNGSTNTKVNEIRS